MTKNAGAGNPDLGCAAITAAAATIAALLGAALTTLRKATR